VESGEFDSQDHEQRDEREERDHRQFDREAERVHQEERERENESRGSLEKRERERVGSEQAGAERKHSPVALPQDLQEALVPARALLHERRDRLRRLLPGCERRRVGDHGAGSAR
jgi:hypothetical protein